MTRLLCALALLPPLSLATVGCDKGTDNPASAPAADGGAKADASADAESKSKSAPESDDEAVVANATAPGKDAPTEAAATTGDDTATSDGGSSGVEDAAPNAAIEDKKVLIMGSSMAATGFGMLLQKALDEHPKIDGLREAKSATGLARPDFFDWMDVGRRQIATHDPDLVVVLIGGNDGQDLQSIGKKKAVHFGDADWEPAYRERIDAFLKLLTEHGAHVLWLGIPRSNTIKLEGKLELIRKIQIAAVEADENATYLPLTRFLEDDDGALIREAKVRGKFKDLRGDDGLHLTMAGSRYLADLVLPEVLEAIDMPAAEAFVEADDADAK